VGHGNRRFSFSEVVRAANLAGRGLSAEEIAREIGHGATVQGIYCLLRRLGLRLAPKARGQVCFSVSISSAAIEIASRSVPGADPEMLLARVLEEALLDDHMRKELIERARE